MAWETPKTNWQAADGVRDTDFNRIEGNIEELYKETVRAARIFYVSKTGNDTTGDGSSANPYATITKALSTIPKNLAGLNITLHIAGGTYAEAVSIKGFTGGVLRLAGSSAAVTINSLSIEGCIVSAVSLPLTLTAAVGLILSECASFNTTGNVNTSGNSIGVSLNTGSNVRIGGNHAHSGGGTAVSCSGNAMYYATNISGSGTLQASNGGIIAATASILSRSATAGGRIHIGNQSTGGNVLADATI